jgi:hypothetical protein
MAGSLVSAARTAIRVGGPGTIVRTASAASSSDVTASASPGAGPAPSRIMMRRWPTAASTSATGSRSGPTRTTRSASKSHTTGSKLSARTATPSAEPSSRASPGIGRSSQRCIAVSAVRASIVSNETSAIASSSARSPRSRGGASTRAIAARARRSCIMAAIAPSTSPVSIA